MDRLQHQHPWSTVASWESSTQTSARGNSSISSDRAFRAAWKDPLKGRSGRRTAPAPPALPWGAGPSDSPPPWAWRSGKDAGPVGHLLIKFPVGDVLLLPVIILPVKGRHRRKPAPPPAPSPAPVPGRRSCRSRSEILPCWISPHPAGTRCRHSPGPAHILFCCYREYSILFLPKKQSAGAEVHKMFKFEPHFYKKPPRDGSRGGWIRSWLLSLQSGEAIAVGQSVDPLSRPAHGAVLWGVGGISRDVLRREEAVNGHPSISSKVLNTAAIPCTFPP